MPNILALDTSGTYCSVALLQTEPPTTPPREGTIHHCIHQHEKAERSHTQRLLPMIQDLLEQAGLQNSQLDAIVYGRGPGSFTGIRIAAGVAQGLAFGLDVPLIPVSTLATLALACQEKLDAQHYPTPVHLLCCIDARMHEVYTASYVMVNQPNTNIRMLETQQPERVCAPSSVQTPTGDYVLCGSGATLAEFPADIVKQAQWSNAEAEPEARFMAALGLQALQAGGAFLPEDALPVYLRDEVTWQRLPRLQP